MEKDFDAWSKEKKEIERASVRRYAHEREIWWCSIGLNIGAEIDGKNANFERPVIIMKVYSRETLVILPLTTKDKGDIFHCRIETKERTVWAKLTQMRVISTKRLLRKVDVLNEQSFLSLRDVWKESL